MMMTTPSDSSLQVVDPLTKRRPDGRFDHVETMVETKLKEVKLEDRPRFYRHYIDENKLDTYIFYDGITAELGESFVRNVIEGFGTHEVYGANGKYPLSTVIRQVDNTGTNARYDEGYENLKIKVKCANEIREKFMKVKEKEKIDAERRIEVKTSKINIDFANMNDALIGTTSVGEVRISSENSSVSSSLLNNSYNNTATNNIKKSIKNINDSSNNVTIKIENIYLTIDKSQLNSLYKKDEEYSFGEFLDRFYEMDRRDQIGLVENLQRIISYSPNLKEYEIYLQKPSESVKGNDQSDYLKMLPRIPGEQSMKEYVLENKGRFIQMEDLIKEKKEKILTSEERQNLMEELISMSSGVTKQEDLINLDSDDDEPDTIFQEEIGEPIPITDTRITLSNDLIGQCFLSQKNINSIEIKTLFNFIVSNIYSNFIFTNIIGDYKEQQKNFTEKLKKFWYTNKNNLNYEFRFTEGGRTSSSHNKTKLYKK